MRRWPAGIHTHQGPIGRQLPQFGEIGERKLPYDLSQGIPGHEVLLPVFDCQVAEETSVPGLEGNNSSAVVENGTVLFRSGHGGLDVTCGPFRSGRHNESLGIAAV